MLILHELILTGEVHGYVNFKVEIVDQMLSVEKVTSPKVLNFWEKRKGDWGDTNLSSDHFLPTQVKYNFITAEKSH